MTDRPSLSPTLLMVQTPELFLISSSGWWWWGSYIRTHKGGASAILKAACGPAHRAHVTGGPGPVCTGFLWPQGQSRDLWTHFCLRPTAHVLARSWSRVKIMSARPGHIQLEPCLTVSNHVILCKLPNSLRVEIPVLS